MIRKNSNEISGSTECGEGVSSLEYSLLYFPKGTLFHGAWSDYSSQLHTNLVVQAQLAADRWATQGQFL